MRALLGLHGLACGGWPESQQARARVAETGHWFGGRLCVPDIEKWGVTRVSHRNADDTYDCSGVR